jgi:hypothetical protein
VARVEAEVSTDLQIVGSYVKEVRTHSHICLFLTAYVRGS